MSGTHPSRRSRCSGGASSFVALSAADSRGTAEDACAVVTDEASVGSDLYHLFSGGSLNLDGLPVCGDLLPAQGSEVSEVDGVTVHCLGVADDMAPAFVVLDQHDVRFHVQSSSEWS